MANEITINAQISLLNGYNRWQFSPSALSVTQTGAGGPTPGYVTIGTIEESVTFSELSTLGWVAIQNLDSTNYVRWGFSAGVYGGRLKAGEFAVFRLNPGTTLYLIANTAACKVLVNALED